MKSEQEKSPGPGFIHISGRKPEAGSIVKMIVNDAPAEVMRDLGGNWVYAENGEPVENPSDWWHPGHEEKPDETQDTAKDMDSLIEEADKALGKEKPAKRKRAAKKKPKARRGAFRKAKAEQAALKIGIYGLSGSGKTFTALLCAEGLARLTGKAIAYVDTERGTDFYAQNVPSRQLHPDAFEFDALYTRSLTEIKDACLSLSPDEYGIVVIDSMTHVWEAAISAYRGKTTSIGSIPFHAWGQIKKPYKELVAWMLSTPMHVFICGRQGNVFAEDEETGELKAVGVKMKAEGETPYEPHILIRMEAVRQKSGDAVITAFAEKDRTGVLAGRTVQWPTFDNLIKPLIPLLGETQAHIATEEETASKDAEKMAERDKERELESHRLMRIYMLKFESAEGREEIEEVSKDLAEVKSKLLTVHLNELRNRYRELAG